MCPMVCPGLQLGLGVARPHLQCRALPLHCPGGQPYRSLSLGLTKPQEAWGGELRRYQEGSRRLRLPAGCGRPRWLL